MGNKETKDIIFDWFAKVSKKAKEPSINPVQQGIFIAIVIWLIISNSTVFRGTNALWNIIITVGSYFLILILRGKIGGTYTELLKSFIEILAGNGGETAKIAKLENLLIMTAGELGSHYEKQINKLRLYVKSKKELI